MSENTCEDLVKQDVCNVEEILRTDEYEDEELDDIQQDLKRLIDTLDQLACDDTSDDDDVVGEESIPFNLESLNYFFDNGSSDDDTHNLNWDNLEPFVCNLVGDVDYLDKLSADTQEVMTRLTNQYQQLIVDEDPLDSENTDESPSSKLD